MLPWPLRWCLPLRLSPAHRPTLAPHRAAESPPLVPPISLQHHLNVPKPLKRSSYLRRTSECTANPEFLPSAPVAVCILGCMEHQAGTGIEQRWLGCCFRFMQAFSGGVRHIYTRRTRCTGNHACIRSPYHATVISTPINGCNSNSISSSGPRTVRSRCGLLCPRGPGTLLCRAVRLRARVQQSAP